MASQKTKFSVGLFVICGIAIALIAFIWLGMSRFLETGRYYVTYFDESVQGLSVDSPVKYRGVSTGRVDSIGVAPDDKLIQVVLKIESGQELGADAVAQLKSVGITGSVFVELDRMKKDEPDRTPVLSFPSKYPVVASKPSELTELLSGLNDIFVQIKTLDLPGISTQIKKTLIHVDRAIDDAQIKDISEEVRLSLGGIKRIVNDEKWPQIIATIREASTGVNTLITDADSSLIRIEKLLAELDGILSKNETSPKKHRHPFFCTCLEKPTSGGDLLGRRHPGYDRLSTLVFCPDRQGPHRY